MSQHAIDHHANGDARAAEILDRMPPADQDAERRYLSAIVQKPELWQKPLRHDDFYFGPHKIIYASLLALAAEQKPINQQTLFDHLRNTPHNSEISAYDFIGVCELTNILVSEPLVANFDHYAEIVSAKSTLRKAKEFATSVLQRATATGANPRELLSDMADELERITPAVNGADRFRLLDCAALDDGQFALTYLVDGILVAGQPCIFAGSKKCLKTTLLIELALCLATGEPFLGKFQIPTPTSVLIMSGESGMATIQETARRIALGMNRALADVVNLFFSDDVPRLDNADDREALRQLLLDRAIKVLVLDPTYLMMPGADAGNLFVQGEMLRAINGVCQPLGVTLILAHHTKKGVADPFSPAELEDIAWAGFQEFCRQWILLSRREKYEQGSGCHKLWFNAGGSAGHSSLWALDISEGAFDGHTPRHWSVDVMPANEAREAAKENIDAGREAAKAEKLAKQIAADSAKIVKAMLKYPDGETRNTIRTFSGVNSAHATRAFDALETAGHIVPCEIIKGRNKHYPALKLAKSADSDNSDKTTRTALSE